MEISSARNKTRFVPVELVDELHVFIIASNISLAGNYRSAMAKNKLQINNRIVVGKEMKMRCRISNHDYIFIIAIAFVFCPHSPRAETRNDTATTESVFSNYNWLIYRSLAPFCVKPVSVVFNTIDCWYIIGRSFLVRSHLQLIVKNYRVPRFFFRDWKLNHWTGTFKRCTQAICIATRAKTFSPTR